MKRLTKFLLIAGASLCLLTACGGDDALEAYTLEESGESVVALDSILDAGEAVMISVDAPTEAATEAGVKPSRTYSYGQMEDSAAVAARYIGVLREEEGFTPIDTLNRQLAKEPNLETLTGAMILARPLESDSKKLCRVAVGWSEYSLAIQVSEVDGRILPPPEPEPEKTEGADGTGAAAADLSARPTSMSEQMEYFYTLDPEKLGLEGHDMNDYMAYAQQGRVLVDDISCREIMVYLADARTGENVYVGTYFFSSDLEHMYKKVGDGKIVVVENFK